MHTVDLSPLYAQLNQLLILVLEAVATMAVGWAAWFIHAKVAPLLARWHITLDGAAESKASADLNTALQNGVAIAMNQAQAWEAAHKDVQIQGQITAWAAQYAVDHAPDAIQRFGLSPQDLAVKAAAYLPPPPASTIGTTGVAVPVGKVETAPLPPPAAAA